MHTDAYGRGRCVALKFIIAYGCLRRAWVGGGDESGRVWGAGGGWGGQCDGYFHKVSRILVNLTFLGKI